MKTDDFDDAIRKKVESIQNAHSEQEVAAVMDYVRIGKTRALRRSYAAIVSLAAAICVIGGLITWNIYQVNEIDGLKQTIAQLNAANTVTDNEKKVSPAPANKISVSSMADHQKSSGSPVGTTHSGIDKSLSLGKKTGTINKNETAVKSGRAMHEEKRNNPVATNPKQAEAITVDGENVIKNNRPDTSDIAVLSAQNVPVKNENADVLKSSDGLNAMGGPDSATETTTIQAPFKPQSDTAAMQSEAGQPSYNKNWHYAAGLGVETGNRQLGIAIVGEAVFKNAWAFSAGLKLLKNGKENFDNDDDFEHHKNNKFKNTYGHDVSEGVNKDIQIRNIIYQVPINVSYIIPFKHHFSMLAGLGTDIDIYIKQHVQYKQTYNLNDLQGRQFVTNSKPVYFNNAVLTLGIQKTIKRFVFQVCPYVNPQLKKVDYKSEKLYYGLRIRTLIRF